MKSARRFFQRYLALALAFASTALAQADPWTSSANALKTAFTGPIATSLIAVSVVVCGLTFAFSDSGKRMLAGIVFGGAMAMGAVRFLAWLYP